MDIVLRGKGPSHRDDERKTALALGLIVALCGAGLWVGSAGGSRAAPLPVLKAPARPFQAGLPPDSVAVEAPSLSAQSPTPKKPITFGSLMSMLKKRTPAPVAAAAAKAYMKSPALAQALRQYMAVPRANERPAADFLRRLGGLPEFHGFMSQMGGNSQARQAFRSLASDPDIDGMIRTAFALPASDSSPGSRRLPESSRLARAFSPSKTAATAAAIGRDAAYGSGFAAKLEAVPAVGPDREASSGAQASAIAPAPAQQADAIGLRTGMPLEASLVPIQSPQAPAPDLRSFIPAPPVVTLPSSPEKPAPKRDKWADAAKGAAMGAGAGLAIGIVIGTIVNPGVGTAIGAGAGATIGAVAGGLFGYFHGFPS